VDEFPQYRDTEMLALYYSCFNTFELMSGLVISIPHVGNDPNPVELICLENTHYVSNSIDNNKHA